MSAISKTVYRLRAALHRKPPGSVDDDFDWSCYTPRYRDDLETMGRDYITVLKQGEYAFIDNELKKSVLCHKSLHPNHHLLYESVLRCRPASVLEVGCGAGDHLHNLGMLGPSLRLCGMDVSESQIDLAQVRHPNLNALILLSDITMPHQYHLAGDFDVVYTQAVLMHIHTGNNYFTALANLFRYARHHVVIVENMVAHEFKKDIQLLFDNDMLPWSEIHFVHRTLGESNCLIISRRGMS